MRFSSAEREAILLKAVWDMIDDMVNLSIFHTPTSGRPTNLIFRSAAQKRLFAILLADVLSRPKETAFPFAFTSSGLPEKETDRTYLHYLEGISRNPRLGLDSSGLAAATTAFADWLNGECYCPEVWIGELDLKFDMRVSRIWLLKVVGDLNKHNFSRLDVRVRQVRQMLDRHGHSFDEGLVYRALPELRHWFYVDIFSYHASTLAEFLNQLRRALFGYLRPEYERAYRRGDRFEGDYRFDIPTDIQAPLAVGMYWELMNLMRSGLDFPDFIISPLLKNHY